MILRLDSEKMTETLIFGQKWPFFTKKGPKQVKQIRLAMVPATANNGHNSMNNLHEILMNSYQINGRKPYLGAKMVIFYQKRVQNGSKILNSFFHK